MVFRINVGIAKVSRCHDWNDGQGNADNTGKGESITNVGWSDLVE